MTTHPDVAALLGSRICHDLSSPLGAIANGFELLTMTGTVAGPEIDLISESIENANARIRYFRIAFGTASEDQQLGTREVRSILGALSRHSRLQITWLPEEDVTRQHGKLAFLLLQCFETAMPWGGQIVVSQQNGGWNIEGTAERMKIYEALWQGLSKRDAPGGVNSSEIQFALVPQMLRETGRELQVELTETRITARF